MPPTKQYVNLPSAAATPERGETRTLRVTPNTVPNVNAGDKVEWWIEPNPGNTDRLYLSPAQRPRLQFNETALTAASGKFENTITFPPSGGDKFIIKAAKVGDRANSLQTDEFETWRKIFYTVHYMGAGAQNLFNSLRGKFEAAFKEAFVELEQVQQIATTTQMARVDATVRPMLGRPQFHFMNDPPAGLIGLKPAGTAALADKPFHAVLLVVPDIYSVKEEPFAMAASRSVTGTTTFNYQLHTAPGNPRAFVYRATASWTGRAALDVKDKLSVVGVPTRRNSVLSWDLSTVPGLTLHLAAAPANTFNLSATLVSESGVMGYSIFNFCIVRTLDGSTDVLQTFTHELGHGVGQTVEKESRWDGPGNALSDEHNPFWHTDPYGGRGPHCQTRAVLRAAPASEGLTTGQWYKYGGAGHLCTMYFSGEPNVQPDGKFCENCVPRLKRFNLNSASMTTRRWNYFG
ncbi:hypothetical protein NVS55_36315 [Myxococcus stipitatus]|uniref:hypothetical protein n=1 Tax=Myxococcus stipitatus TaxID=83455 RepID=UPI0031453DC6